MIARAAPVMPENATSLAEMGESDGRCVPGRRDARYYVQRHDQRHQLTIYEGSPEKQGPSFPLLYEVGYTTPTWMWMNS
jgi:hypothetical protein